MSARGKLSRMKESLMAKLDDTEPGSLDAQTITGVLLGIQLGLQYLDEEQHDEAWKLKLRILRQNVLLDTVEYDRTHCNYCEGVNRGIHRAVERIDEMLGVSDEERDR